MKCDDCFNLLEEYIDGEAIERDAAQISAHLITCAACAHEFEALTAEREVYARYDRELAGSPAMWSAIAARTTESRPIVSGSRFNLSGWLAGLFATPSYAFAGAAAVVIFALLIGVVFLRTRTPEPPRRPEAVAGLNKGLPTPTINGGGSTVLPKVIDIAPPEADKHRTGEISGTRPPKNLRRSDQGGVLFTDAAYTDIEDKDTANHVAQAENLLRSVRNLQTSDDDEEVDVSYEKAESRRLLDDNVVLRRDAEMAGKYPVKKLLGELEPFLIDIANLPDKTTPTDLRAIKDRVQKTEIVAALRSY
jgi:putative zinc finger protein